MDCFVRRASAEYEYLGHYAFHNQFGFLTDQEVEQYISREAFELWSKSIDESEWGLALKNRAQGIMAIVREGGTQIEPSTTKTAKEVFQELSYDTRWKKLRFYWMVFYTILLVLVTR
jgi:hypothetical protein